MFYDPEMTVMFRSWCSDFLQHKSNHEPEGTGSFANTANQTVAFSQHTKSPGIYVISKVIVLRKRNENRAYKSLGIRLSIVCNLYAEMCNTSLCP